MLDTQFKNKKVVEDAEAWTFNSTTVTHTITGELADAVRARTGKTGTVKISEVDYASGTCELCSWESIDFSISVGSVQVFYGDGNFDNPEKLSSFVKFTEWLAQPAGTPYKLYDSETEMTI
jgi:hypothetical protein